MEIAVSFLGLGNMGFPMASNLLTNGIKLFVYNRSEDKAVPLIKKGAQLLQTPSEAFERSKIAISMVSNDQALHSIVEGPHGLLEKGKPGCIHVSMSTISPRLSRNLEEKHQEKGMFFLSAPVFGRPEAAAKKELIICLSGKQHAQKQAEPLLKMLGKKIYDFGEDPGAANNVKLAGNFMILSSVEILSEAFAFAEKSNIPLQTFQSLLTESLFSCPVFQNYTRILTQREFSPAGFKMSLGLKDIDLFLRAADFLRVPTPVAGILHDRLMTGLANKREELDWSAIALTALEEAGIALSNPP